MATAVNKAAGFDSKTHGRDGVGIQRPRGDIPTWGKQGTFFLWVDTLHGRLAAKKALAAVRGKDVADRLNIISITARFCGQSIFILTAIGGPSEICAICDFQDAGNRKSEVSML